MKSRVSGVVWVFGALLAVTFVGIVVHQLTGSSYPVTSPSADFELNVLGDIYEAAVLVPLGLLAIVAMRSGRRYAVLLVTGVTAHFAYNYAMGVTGRQNIWTFVWIAKLALSVVVMCLVCPILPTGAGLKAGSRRAIIAYLVLLTIVFTGLMGQRLWKSAMGQAVDMTMQQNGVVDWGDPVLRDPVIFLSFVVPALVAAIVGLAKNAEWGKKAAAASCALVVSIVSVVLFTGPLKELLMNGSVAVPMLGMSGIMLLAAGPAAWFLVKIAKEKPVSKEAW